MDALVLSTTDVHSTNPTVSMPIEWFQSSRVHDETCISMFVAFHLSVGLVMDSGDNQGKREAFENTHATVGMKSNFLWLRFVEEANEIRPHPLLCTGQTLFLSDARWSSHSIRMGKTRWEMSSELHLDRWSFQGHVPFELVKNISIQSNDWSENWPFRTWKGFFEINTSIARKWNELFFASTLVCIPSRSSFVWKERTCLTFKSVTISSSNSSIVIDKTNKFRPVLEGREIPAARRLKNSSWAASHRPA